MCILIIQTIFSINKKTEQSWKVWDMDIYLIVSVICENSIDALRSYSAKKKQRIQISLSLSFTGYMHETANTAIILVSLLPSYRRTCSTMSAGTEKTLTGVRLVIFCSRSSCWMACMICWVCLMPTLIAWQKSGCSTFSADASIITDEQPHWRCIVWIKSSGYRYVYDLFSHVFWQLTHLTAGSSSHNQVKNAGAHFCPSRVDQ